MSEFIPFPVGVEEVDPEKIERVGRHLHEFEPVPRLRPDDWGYGLFEGLSREAGPQRKIVGLYQWSFGTKRAAILHSSKALEKFEGLVHLGYIKCLGFYAVSR